MLRSREFRRLAAQAIMLGSLIGFWVAAHPGRYYTLAPAPTDWSRAEAQFLSGQDGFGGMWGMPGASSPVVFRDSFLTSGPLIADDSNTKTHLTWNGSALVDSKSNVTWTMNGTVPQVSGSTASPLFPSGFGSNPRSGAGPFSSSNNYSTPSSGSPLNPAGGTPFYVCAVVIPSTTADSFGSLMTVYNGSSLTGWGLVQTNSTWTMAAGVDLGLGSVVVGGVNVVCGGSDGTHAVGMANLGSYASSATTWTQYTAVPISIGFDNEGDQPFAGTILELIYEAATPSSGVFTAIEQRVFSHIADTGQALTVSRASTASYTTNGHLWYAPAGVLRVESNGLLVEGTSTNYVLQSGDPSNAAYTTQGTITVTGNSGVGPDGNTTLTKIVSTSLNGSRYQSVTVPSGTVFTVSAWVLPNVNGDTESVAVNCGTGATPSACTCLRASGAACNTAISGSNCTAYATFSGLDRMAATMTCPVAQTTANPLVGPGQYTVSSSGTGYFGDIQYEAGYFPTTYIPTTSTSSTRSPDLISITNPLTMTTNNYCGGAKVTPYFGAVYGNAAVGRGILGAGASGFGNANTADMFTNAEIIYSPQYDNGGNMTRAQFSLPNDSPATFLGCNVSGTQTIWRNGSLVNTTTPSVGTGLLSSNPATVFLGSMSGGTTYWTNGNLQNFLLCSSSDGSKCQ